MRLDIRERPGRHERNWIERRIAELEGKGSRVSRAEAAELDRLLVEHDTSMTDRHDAIKVALEEVQRSMK